MGKQSWDDVPEGGGSESYFDKITQMDLPPNEWVTFRLIGDPFSLALHYVPVKKRDGSKTNFPMVCGRNEEGGSCILCDLGFKTSETWLSNVINRDTQENKPRNAKEAPAKAEVRTPKDKWWSPVEVVRLPPSGARKIKGLRELNRRKTEKGLINAHLSDPKYGRDVMCMYRPDESGAGKYDIQMGAEAPLDSEEKKMLLFDLEETVNGTIRTEEDLRRTLEMSFNKDALTDEDCNLDAVQDYLNSNGSTKKSANKGKNKKKGERDMLREKLEGLTTEELIDFIEDESLDVGKTAKALKKMSEDDIIDLIIECTGDDEEGGDTDLEDMDEEELLAYIEENDIELDIPSKKLKKMDADELREAIAEAQPKSKGKDKDKDKGKSKGKSDDKDKGKDKGGKKKKKETDLEDMDEEELLAYIEENDIELDIPSKKLKKMDADELREAIAEATAEGDDDAESKDEIDFDDMSKEDLVEYAEDHDLELDMTAKELKKADADDIRDALAIAVRAYIEENDIDTDMSAKELKKASLSELVVFLGGDKGASGSADLEDMDEEELLAYIEENDIELDIPSKKLKKMDADELREAIAEAASEGDDDEGDDDEEDEKPKGKGKAKAKSDDKGKSKGKDKPKGKSKK